MSKCKWCGEEFNKKHNRQMYCSDNCREYARQEQIRINRRRYYHKYKDVMIEEKKYGLGSGFLSMHRHKNDTKELIAVKNELRKLKIKT